MTEPNAARHRHFLRSTVPKPVQLPTLLQLPKDTLSKVLQQLDPGSLAHTALTCSALREASCNSLISVSKDVSCITPNKLSRLLSLVTLEHLRLTHLKANTLPSGVPSQLVHLTGLQLAFECYNIDLAQQFQHLSSLKALQQLSVSCSCIYPNNVPPGTLMGIQHLSQLTSLQLSFDSMGSNQAVPCNSMQGWTSLTALQKLFLCGFRLQTATLSELTQLRDLSLCASGLDAVPSQLVQLTCLQLAFDDYRNDFAQQFQHLSSLTALQQLSVTCRSRPINVPPGTLMGIQHLSQLTSLQLWFNNRGRYHAVPGSSMQGWTSLTALQKLSLCSFRLPTHMLSELTKLRDLYLHALCLDGAGGQATPLSEVLGVLPQLSLLTALDLFSRAADLQGTQPPAAAAFTALAANTNLCSLRVHLSHAQAPQWCVVFRPGVVYPHLQEVSLKIDVPNSPAPVQPLSDDELRQLVCANTAMPMGRRQLQRLRSCCPNLGSLTCVLCRALAPAAFKPLQQLSALTHLRVSTVKPAVIPAAPLLRTAAQLPGLKQLALSGFPFDGPALLQLTVLTALECLLHHETPDLPLVLKNTASSNESPDVWRQLLDHLNQ